MLELKEIKKSYKIGENRQQVLKGININFRDKDFVSILGASGSGKTTLLNIIGGLDKYDDGDLIIDGVSTKKYSSNEWDSYRNHKIGFIFQNYNLIGHQTILANVELSLTLSGISKKNRKARAIKALEEVGLKDHINKKPNQLSGGQMQRVAIARALVNDPDIILADEPTGALDSNTSIQIMDILKKISKNKLIIMVTHNPELAKQYSTRIIELKDGLILKDSAPYTSENVKASTEKTKKTSMAFSTSLLLSLKNLMNKKGRTFLTAIAGSIGIIGIALIISLSNGVQNYAKSLESSSSEDYPIELGRTATNLFDASNNTNLDNKAKAEDNHVVAYDDITEKTKSDGLNMIKYNNLQEFKKYLDSNEEIKNYAKDIEYGYNIDLQVYSNKSYERIESIDFSNINSSYSSNNQSIFMELSGNREVLDKNYELLTGKMPENFDEAILIVGEDGNIPISTLYALDLKNKKELLESIEKIVKGENTEINNEQISYDEILSLSYKTILNTDYYKLQNDKLVDLSNNKDYMKGIIDNGIDLKIVGIVKSKDPSANIGMVGYTKELTNIVINKINETDIAKKQLENSNIDIFTGKEFDGMTTTFDKNLESLGIVDVENPNTIKIYPKNADSKEKIIEIINKYNDEKKASNREDLTILYVDSMKEMISGINSIIKMVTYILVAVVAISLVVSSIMIAIITYISVLERTKEIGILRAIGATKKDIIRVFEAETIIEGLISGLLGIGVTLIINLIINVLVENFAKVSNISNLSLVNIIVLISLSVGLNWIAGLIPSKMASKKDPVEPLRTE